MKIIRLKTGESCFVDDADFEWLSLYEWKLHPKGYAYRSGGPGIRLMHREILGLKKGQITDHEDRNKLNNQRSNLRQATHSQNHGNVWHKKNGASSRFKGVYFHKKSGKWAAQLQGMKKGKRTRFHLGLHGTEEEAARAYNAYAVRYFGKEFALLNPV
jgi:hypothetical protein